MFVMVEDMRQQGQALNEPIGLPGGPYKLGKVTHTPPMERVSCDRPLHQLKFLDLTILLFLALLQQQDHGFGP